MAWDKFDKLIELIKRRISSIVLYKLKDPRIGFVTITKIDLSRDLKDCKVFYTVYGTPGEISRTAHAMNDARGFIQREVAKTLRTRVIPRIVFIPDESIEGVERVERLLDDLRKERQETGPAMEGVNDEGGDGEE